jgi:hypothetical protein
MTYILYTIYFAGNTYRKTIQNTLIKFEKFERGRWMIKKNFPRHILKENGQFKSEDLNTDGMFTNIHIIQIVWYTCLTYTQIYELL